MKLLHRCHMSALIVTNRNSNVFMFVSFLRLGVRCMWSQLSDGGRGASCSSLDWEYPQEVVLRAVFVDLRQKK